MITRTAVAFLVATLIPAIAFAMLTPVSDGGINTNVASVLGLTFAFYWFSFGAAVLFGVPLFFLLLKLRLVRWWSALVSGAIVGALVAVVLRLPGSLNPKDFLDTVPLGALAAFAFWLIWRPRHDA